MLRSFNSRHAPYNPTVVEGIRAAWATPGLFSPATFGPYLMQEAFVSGVNGFNNPALEAIREAHDVYGGSLSTVALLLSIGAGRQPVLSIDSSDVTQRISQDTENTARELQRRLSKVNMYFRFSAMMENQMRSLGDITSHTAAYLEEYPVTTLMERCLLAANNIGRLTLGDLCESPPRKHVLSHVFRTVSLPHSSPKTSLGLLPLSPPGNSP